MEEWAESVLPASAAGSGERAAGATSGGKGDKKQPLEQPRKPAEEVGEEDEAFPQMQEDEQEELKELKGRPRGRALPTGGIKRSGTTMSCSFCLRQ